MKSGKSQTETKVMIGLFHGKNVVNVWPPSVTALDSEPFAVVEFLDVPELLKQWGAIADDCEFFYIN